MQFLERQSKLLKESALKINSQMMPEGHDAYSGEATKHMVEKDDHLPKVEEEVSKEVATNFATLYRITDATGTLQTEEITQRPFKRSHLNSLDAFILELEFKIYIWIGLGSSTIEKKNAIQIGKSFIELHDKPTNTTIDIVIENMENEDFKEYF